LAALRTGLFLRFPPALTLAFLLVATEDIPELKLPKDMMDLAGHIVSNKSGHFDPSHFEDRYENALIDLLKKKEAGEKITPVRGAPPGASPC
jgi:non-homologous end joining protein Ku